MLIMRMADKESWGRSLLSYFVILGLLRSGDSHGTKACADVLCCAVLFCCLRCRFGFKSDLLRAMYAVTDGFRYVQRLQLELATHSHVCRKRGVDTLLLVEI